MNLSVNNIICSINSTLTSDEMIKLTSASAYNQVFTGTKKRTVMLPDAKTLSDLLTQVVVILL